MTTDPLLTGRPDHITRDPRFTADPDRFYVELEAALIGRLGPEAGRAEATKVWAEAHQIAVTP